MLKNTHIEVGLSLTLFISIISLIYFGYFPIYAYLLLPIFAVLPDADHPESTLNKKFPIFKIFSKINGHRTWSHDLFTIFILSIGFYLLFGKIFGYYDSISILDNVEDKWRYLKFFIFSKEFWGIYIAMFSHIFGDFLTKGGLKFFYWITLIAEKTKTTKNYLFKILGFPFLILNKVLDLIESLRYGLFPKTGSKFELIGYGLLFNIINILGIGYLFLPNSNFSKILNGTLSHIDKGRYYWIFLFFLISIIYFFSINFGKLKKYIGVFLKVVKFVVISSILLFGFYFGFKRIISSGYIENVYLQMLIIAGLSFGVLYGTYKKTIGMKIALFNIILNEVLFLIFYFFMTFLIFKFYI